MIRTGDRGPGNVYLDLSRYQETGRRPGKSVKKLSPADADWIAVLGSPTIIP